MKRSGFIFILAISLLCAGLTSCKEKVTDNVESLPTCAGDLVGHTVAVISGAAQDIAYDKLFGENMLRINSAPEVLAACETGVAEYCMMDTVHFIGSHAEEKGVHYCFTDTLGGNVAVAFNKASTDLCNTFNKWLEGAKADGTMAEIIDRWVTGDVEQAELPDFGPEPEGEPLRIGLTTDFPFAFVKNGTWTGLEVDMAERWGRSIGRPISYQVFDFSAFIAALETNRIDAVCSFMYVTKERQKRILFSEPYHTSHTVCFKNVGNAAAEKVTFWQKTKDSFNDNLVKEDRWKLLVQGLWETVIISFWAILFGTIIGALICWMRMSSLKFFSGLARVIIDIVRGIPVLVFLMVLFYIVFASSGLTARWVAIIAFSINFGAYVSEMFRTSINGVDKGQTEAGLSLGYTKLRTFFRFIVPQALKKVVPVYKGEVVSIIKSTSIVGYIAIQDLTKMSDIIRSRTFDAFFPLIIISIIYFLITWLIGLALDKIVAQDDRG
jgi:amine acid ABC transporter, permease protein, 3-TM region, His/Glu/Gln/Arg/opine family